MVPDLVRFATQFCADQLRAKWWLHPSFAVTARSKSLVVRSFFFAGCWAGTVCLVSSLFSFTEWCALFSSPGVAKPGAEGGAATSPFPEGWWKFRVTVASDTRAAAAHVFLRFAATVSEQLTVTLQRAGGSAQRRPVHRVQGKRARRHVQAQLRGQQ